MGQITRLDAVNQMLLSAGESLVADLENNSGVDTELAEFILDQTSQDYQLRGLANNRFVKKFRLTTAGEIVLPEDTMAAELTSNHTDTDGNVIIGIDRQLRLFNITDNTLDWKKDTDYYVEIIFNLPWLDLSTPSQRAILATAQRQYQLIVQGDDISDRYLGEVEALHRARGRASDINDRRRTVFSSGSNIMQQALNRVSGVNNDPSRFRYWRGKRS
jgi:hypothetical protein